MHRHNITDSFHGSLAKGRALEEGSTEQIAAVVWGARTKQGRQRTFQNRPKGDASLGDLVVGFPAAMTTSWLDRGCVKGSC